MEIEKIKNQIKSLKSIVPINGKESIEILEQVIAGEWVKREDLLTKDEIVKAMMSEDSLSVRFTDFAKAILQAQEEKIDICQKCQKL